MSGVPRSQRLISYAFAGVGVSPAFVCPDNSVVLVKSAYFWNGGAAPAPVNMYASFNAGAAIAAVFYDTVEATTVAVWDGWFVLHPGDYVAVQSSAADLVVTVSGAVLAGGPPYPPAELAEPLFIPPAAMVLPAPTRRRR